jgi:hypothetical protein
VGSVDPHKNSAVEAGGGGGGEGLKGLQEKAVGWGGTFVFLIYAGEINCMLE